MAKIDAATRAFLQQPITACLTTLRPDGSPHQSYVWYKLDGDTFLISTEEQRVKARNVRHDPRAALSVLDPENPYRWLSFSGTVEITREGANDLIMELALHYQGEAGREYGRQMQGPARVVLRLPIEHVSGQGF